MTTQAELQKAFNLTEDIARLKAQFPPEEIQAILDALNVANVAIDAFYRKRAATPGAVYLTQFLIRYYAMRAGSSAAALTLDTKTDPANVYAAVLQRVLTGMSVVAMEVQAGGGDTSKLQDFVQMTLAEMGKP